MKIKLYCDEYYPFYDLLTDGFSGWSDVEVEVPTRTVNRWKKALAEISKVQDEIREAVDAQSNP